MDFPGQCFRGLQHYQQTQTDATKCITTAVFAGGIIKSTVYSVMEGLLSNCSLRLMPTVSITGTVAFQ